MARDIRYGDARALEQRGRTAEWPSQMGRSGWFAIAKRVKRNLTEHNASLVAAGLAQFALLAAFPALAAAISLYGLIASPDQIAGQFEAMAGILPEQARTILSEAMQNLASGRSGALGFGALVGLLVALWGARKGMSALMTAANIAYGETEQRSFIRQTLVSLGLTLGAVLGFLSLLALVIVAPLLQNALELPAYLHPVVAIVRWGFVWLFIVVALSVVYRYAPDRRRPRWRWVTWGAAVAATLWLIGSLLFSLYVQHFGSYGATYGALGGVVVLLLWLYLSGYIVMLGAEINAETERQTTRETTRDPPDRTTSVTDGFRRHPT